MTVESRGAGATPIWSVCRTDVRSRNRKPYPAIRACGANCRSARRTATAGDYGAATSRGKSKTGADGVCVARGNGVCVCGGLGSLLVIAEENDINCRIKAWKAVVVDGETIKPDTWYELKNGEFAEVLGAEHEEGK